MAAKTKRRSRTANENFSETELMKLWEPIAKMTKVQFLWDGSDYGKASQNLGPDASALENAHLALRGLVQVAPGGYPALKPLKNVLIELAKQYDVFNLKKSVDDIIPDAVIMAKAHFAADIWRVKCIHLLQIKERKSGTCNAKLKELTDKLRRRLGDGGHDGDGGGGDGGSSVGTATDAPDEDIPRSADGLPDFSSFQGGSDEEDTDVEMVATLEQPPSTPRKASTRRLVCRHSRSPVIVFMKCQCEECRVPVQVDDDGANNANGTQTPPVTPAPVPEEVQQLLEAKANEQQQEAKATEQLLLEAKANEQLVEAKARRARLEGGATEKQHAAQVPAAQAAATSEQGHKKHPLRRLKNLDVADLGDPPIAPASKGGQRATTLQKKRLEAASKRKEKERMEKGGKASHEMRQSKPYRE